MLKRSKLSWRDWGKPPKKSLSTGARLDVATHIQKLGESVLHWKGPVAVLRAVSLGWGTNYSFLCHPVDYSNSESSIRVLLTFRSSAVCGATPARPFSDQLRTFTIYSNKICFNIIFLNVLHWIDVSGALRLCLVSEGFIIKKQPTIKLLLRSKNGIRSGSTPV
jgi:hypothetical protein